MKMISSSERFRFFVDLTQEGCPCGCVYCFVKSGNEKLLHRDEIERMPEKLFMHEGFIPGPQGTLLALGAHCDLFRTSDLANHHLFALQAIAQLGNPIQICTKQFILPEWSERIAKVATYDNQIVVFVSCATMWEQDFYEPYAAPLERRFQSFMSLHSAGVPSCFYIKPFLADVTDRHPEHFVEAIRAFCPDVCCVGVLYLNEEITNRLKPLRLCPIPKL